MVTLSPAAANHLEFSNNSQTVHLVEDADNKYRVTNVTYRHENDVIFEDMKISISGNSFSYSSQFENAVDRVVHYVVFERSEENKPEQVKPPTDRLSVDQLTGVIDPSLVEVLDEVKNLVDEDEYLMVDEETHFDDLDPIVDLSDAVRKELKVNNFSLLPDEYVTIFEVENPQESSTTTFTVYYDHKYRIESTDPETGSVTEQWTEFAPAGPTTFTAVIDTNFEKHVALIREYAAKGQYAQKGNGATNESK